MMRAIVVVALAATMAMWPHLGFAEGAFAVWLSNGDPKHGYAMGASSDAPTAAEAQSRALAECRKQAAKLGPDACRIVGTFHDECLQDAFNGDASTPSTAVGWAVAADREAANRRAMEVCEQMQGAGRPCQLDGQPLCDGKAK